MNVLIACEESQRVCISMRYHGYKAYSCDIQECSGGYPEWHIQDDVLKILNGGFFRTCDSENHYVDHWDLIIAHPPCTYLTVAGNRWFNIEKYGEKAKERIWNRNVAIDFFLSCINAPADYVAVENPVGTINSVLKPTQIIQPYEYGHPYSKKTCLWLKNLPALRPTKIVEPEIIHSKGKSGGYSGNSWVVRDENGKILSYNDPRVAKERSKTYWGIADAMADQWGKYVEEMIKNVP